MKKKTTEWQVAVKEYKRKYRKLEKTFMKFEDELQTWIRKGLRPPINIDIPKWKPIEKEYNPERYLRYKTHAVDVEFAIRKLDWVTYCALSDIETLRKLTCMMHGIKYKPRFGKAPAPWFGGDPVFENGKAVWK